MKYPITFAPEAQEDYDGLRAHERALVRDAINEHLQHEPTRESKSRIKRLRELERPQFRLWVGGIRVFYDVIDDEVLVLSILEKSAAVEWLKKWST